MPHFLIKKENIKENEIILNSNDDAFFHIVKVLRIKNNDKIKFIDKDKNVYYSNVSELNKNTLIAKINSIEKSNRYLKNEISLIQCILVGDSQNEAISNATQCGVKEIYPVISDNVSVKKSALKDKPQKWFKIMLENFKQCERADFAYIHEIFDLKEVLAGFKKENILIFAEKDENTPLQSCLKNIDKEEKIAIVIGPEGGFSNDEFKYFKEQNYKLISLGKMIFKAPNAITASITNIVSRLEEDL